MIKPTVGRVVWYNPGKIYVGPDPRGQPHAGIVTYVHSDSCVNLALFDSNGVAYSRTSVTLFQGDTDRPSGAYAEWMPYQLGQAAKTEAVLAAKDAAKAA